MQKDTNSSAQIPTEAIVTPVGVRALCCQCGQLNTFGSTRQSPKVGGIHQTGEGVIPGDVMPAEDDTLAWSRCVIFRHCPNCRVHTNHAYLRDDKYRDALEVMLADRRASDARHGGPG